MKGDSILPRAPELKYHHWTQLTVKSRIPLLEKFTPHQEKQLVCSNPSQLCKQICLVSCVSCMQVKCRHCISTNWGVLNGSINDACDYYFILDSIPDTEESKRAGLPSIESIVVKSCLRWSDHVVQMDDSCLPNLACCVDFNRNL